ncbi:MAG: hypothetical protein KDD46_05630 [Bdellovibrionales bacterium]|nr:hypothetical protein [Bdellovibrionales bacterium]
MKVVLAYFLTIVMTLQCTFAQEFAAQGSIFLQGVYLLDQKITDWGSHATIQLGASSPDEIANHTMLELAELGELAENVKKEKDQEKRKFLYTMMWIYGAEYIAFSALSKLNALESNILHKSANTDIKQLLQDIEANRATIEDNRAKILNKLLNQSDFSIERRIFTDLDLRLSQLQERILTSSSQQAWLDEYRRNFKTQYIDQIREYRKLLFGIERDMQVLHAKTNSTVAARVDYNGTEHHSFFLDETTEVRNGGTTKPQLLQDIFSRLSKLEGILQDLEKYNIAHAEQRNMLIKQINEIRTSLKDWNFKTRGTASDLSTHHQGLIDKSISRLTGKRIGDKSSTYRIEYKEGEIAKHASLLEERKLAVRTNTTRLVAGHFAFIFAWLTAVVVYEIAHDTKIEKPELNVELPTREYSMHFESHHKLRETLNQPAAALFVDKAQKGLSFIYQHFDELTAQ